MPKNICQINVKLDLDLRDAIIALAHINGLTASEFMRSLAIEKLTEKLDELSVLQAWAKDTGNLGNDINEQ